MAPLRDHRTLLEEAATVHAQAKALHQAAVDNLGSEHEEWGARRDAAMREADSARHNATQADKQADELYGQSNYHAEQAGERDADGAQVVDSRPLEAEYDFEQSRAWVRHAEALSNRADDARQAAREWAQKADELEKTAHAIDNEPDRPTFIAPKLKALADQLDDKARLLEEAAQKQVDAANEQAAGDPGAASASRNWANYALQQADGMQLEYGSLDPQVLRAAGIPLSQIPDSALMDPNDATAAVAPAGTGNASPDDVSGAARYDDTDLMDPNDSAAADVDPTVPAVDDTMSAPEYDNDVAVDAVSYDDNADTYGDSYADPGAADTYGDSYADSGAYDDASAVSDVSAYEPSFDA